MEFHLIMLVRSVQCISYIERGDTVFSTYNRIVKSVFQLIISDHVQAKKPRKLFCKVRVVYYLL